MKKDLILSFFVAFIMVTSLAPLTIAAPSLQQDSSPSTSIADYIAKQTDQNLQRRSLSTDSLDDELQTDKLFVGKTDEVLSGWINEGKYTELISTVNDKPSIMMMVAGNDPTLNGEIDPLGSFYFENGGVTWVHVATDRKQITSLVEHPNVLRLEADKKYHQEAFENLEPLESSAGISTDALQEFNDPFYANDIIGATYVNETFGYNGTGTTVNVMDSGIDLGHSALKHAMALTNSNTSASFAFGYQTVLSQLYTQKHYENIGDTQRAADFAPLHSNANGFIDTSGLGKLQVWLTAYEIMGTVENTGLPWMPSIPLPSQFYVGDLPGNDTGYAFGFGLVYNGGDFVLTPFVQADANDDGDYDTLYVDYNTARHYTQYYRGITTVESFIFNVAPKNFTLFAPHTNTNNQALSADFRGFEGETPDGFVDVSLGALSNNFDEFNFTGRLGNADPLIRGIDPSGMMFAYFGDSGSHGTGVAGEIAAKQLDYEIDGTQLKIGGAAPGTKIIGTQYFSDTQYIYGNLWVTGYEPNVDLEWEFVNDHIANVTTNSWGYPAFEYDGFAYSYDLKTLFMELLSQPGYVQANHPGILVVFSAGNSGPGYGTIASSPVGGTFIMVGASTAFGWMEEDIYGLFGEAWANTSQGFDEIVGFSSSGPTVTNYPKVDVVNIGAFDFSIAPTLQTGNNNVSSTLFSGTSEAAPLTAGVLSLMYQAWDDIQGTNFDPDTAKTILKSTALDLGYDALMQGSGRVDAKSAVHAIVDGALPSGEDLLVAYSTDSLDNLGTKLAGSFEYLFGTGNTSIAGYTGLDFPTVTEDIKDTALFGGSILPGQSGSLTMNVDGGTIADLEAITFETLNTQTSSQQFSSNEYTYYKLFDLIDESQLTEGEYFKIMASYTKDTLNPRARYDGYPWMFLMQHNDTDNDGIVDKDERQLYNLDLSSSITDSLFFSERLLNENTYVMIWDTLYPFAGQLGLTSLKYDFTVQTYSRTVASEISFSGTTSPVTVTISPAANAMPGIEQGFVRVNGTTGDSLLVPYTYTVPLEVDDYDVSGWSEITGDRNQPLENGVYSAVDTGWRFSTGDWRYYELDLTGTTANTLGLEVEWTYEDTVLDVYVIDNDGQIVAKSDIIYDGAGVFSSKANNAPTMQRLLVDVSDYRTGNTLTGGDFSSGYDTFTIAIHAVIVDRDAVPFDPISVRASWVTETVSQFQNPQPTLVTTGSTTYDGLAVTSDNIGIEWSQVSSNPIPSFTNVNQDISIRVSQGLVVNEQRTIPSAELVSYEDAGGIDPEWTETVFLERGAQINAFLDWEHDSDFDFVVVPEGSTISFANDILGAQLASAAKPEVGTGSVPASGNYILAVEWFSGDGGIDQPFTLEFEASTSVYTDSTSSSSSLTTSLSANNIPNSKYTLRSSTGGWNFDGDYAVEFYYDDSGPSIDYQGQISEETSGEVVIGQILDAVEYDFSISYDGIILSSSSNVNGPQNLVIDTDLVENVLQNYTFTVVATDDLEYTTTEEMIIVRTDETDPELLTTPEDGMEVYQDADSIFSFDIADASQGEYLIRANGDEVGSGTWVGGQVNDLVAVFTELGDFFVRFDFTDISGNSENHVIQVTVVRDTRPASEADGGFLSVPTTVFFAIIAIPILMKKLKIRVE